MRLLIGLLEIIVVQTYVIYNDLKSIHVDDDDDDDDDDEVSIRQFACELPNVIQQSIN